MRTRICKHCGRPFVCPTGSDLYLCPDCHQKAKLSSVYRERTCPSCGTKFWGYPKSIYCPDCQAERDKEANKRSRQNPHKRKIGSTAYCEKCGKPYTVTSGKQRYCPDCAKSAVTENIRKAKREYYARNREKAAAYKKEMRNTEYVCMICGKRFKSATPRVTCSEACDRERRRRIRNRADIKRGRRKIAAEDRYIHEKPQSGIVGVTWCRGKWQATWKKHYIGVFSTVEEAAAAINDYRSKGEMDAN